MVDLEIWSCEEHDHTEYFLTYQSDLRERWDMEHDYEYDESCEPDIEKIDVEEIEGEMID